MGFLIGFSPWIVYWILVGNMPFRGAVLIALGLSVIAVAVQRIRKQPWHSLEVGAVVVFVILSVLSFTVSDRFLEQWLQPLGNAGIFLVALTGLLIDAQIGYLQAKYREFADSRFTAFGGSRASPPLPRRNGRDRQRRTSSPPARNAPISA